MNKEKTILTLPLFYENDVQINPIEVFISVKGKMYTARCVPEFKCNALVYEQKNFEDALYALLKQIKSEQN